MEIRKVLIVGSTALIGWSVYKLRKVYKFNKYLKRARAIDQVYYEMTLKEVDELKRMHNQLILQEIDILKMMNDVEINAPILN